MAEPFIIYYTAGIIFGSRGKQIHILFVIVDVVVVADDDVAVVLLLLLLLISLSFFLICSVQLRYIFTLLTIISGRLPNIDCNR